MTQISNGVHSRLMKSSMTLLKETDRIQLLFQCNWLSDTRRKKHGINVWENNFSTISWSEKGQICAFKRTSGPSSMNYFGSASRTSRKSGKSGRRRMGRMIKRFAFVIPQITNWTSSQKEETLGDDM